MVFSNNQEVLIIGGGVIGLSIARELHKCGVGQITLVEKRRCGEESSCGGGDVGTTGGDERNQSVTVCFSLLFILGNQIKPSNVFEVP